MKKTLRYIHTNMSDFKMYAEVWIVFLPVVKVGKCVELTIIEYKLDGFLVIGV